MGKSIRIFLADAEVSGIRHAEIVNWTGQALAFPRAKVSELESWPEISRQGVYFLLGIDEETGQDAVYVGEAESVATRISQHLKDQKKEFWSECIAFTSKDENLTKSHIKYLESRLVASALQAERYVIKNSSTPQESGLPRADRSAMDEFAAHVKTLLGVLGHRVLDPVRSIPKSNLDSENISTSGKENLNGIEITSDNFRLSMGDISATAIRETDSFLVLAGSFATKTINPNLQNGYKNVRERLIQSGTLIEKDGQKYVFTKDCPFPSSSQAACVIVGYSISGPQNWRNTGGKTLREIERSEAQSLEKTTS
jgi:hypothetical protein